MNEKLLGLIGILLLCAPALIGLAIAGGVGFLLGVIITILLAVNL